MGNDAVGCNSEDSCIESVDSAVELLSIQIDDARSDENKHCNSQCTCCVAHVSYVHEQYEQMGALVRIIQRNLYAYKEEHSVATRSIRAAMREDLMRRNALYAAVTDRLMCNSQSPDSKSPIHSALASIGAVDELLLEATGNHDLATGSIQEQILARQRMHALHTRK